jgi:hypothetical protein
MVLGFRQERARRRYGMIRSPQAGGPSATDSTYEVAELIELDPRLQEKPGPFEFWYRLTAPPKQPLSAPFEAREAARRGRLTSTVLVMVFGSMAVLVIPSAIITHNPEFMGTGILMTTLVTLALFLNRLGKGLLGSWLLVIGMNIGLFMALVTYTGGLSVNALPLMDILVVEPILVAMFLLPLWSVFLFGLIDVILIGLVFLFVPHTPDLNAVLNINGYETVTRPIYLLVFVIAVVYPVTRSLLKAIIQSDRAKEIARAQHDLAHREAQIVQEKQVLDEDIQHLVAALTQVTNGSVRAQFPYPATQSLWPITGALHNLFARVRTSRRHEAEFEQTRLAVEKLIMAIRQSQQTGQPLRISRTGNIIIDPLIIELMSGYPHTVSPPSRTPSGSRTSPLGMTRRNPQSMWHSPDER